LFSGREPGAELTGAELARLRELWERQGYEGGVVLLPVKHGPVPPPLPGDTRQPAKAGQRNGIDGYQFNLTRVDGAVDVVVSPARGWAALVDGGGMVIRVYRDCSSGDGGAVGWWSSGV
jgi:hypothetical protein